MRPLLRLLIVGVTLVGLFALSGPAFADVWGKVATGGGSANLRVRATSNSIKVHQRANGKPLRLVCRAQGQKVGATRRWYKLGRGALISAALVRAPKAAGDLPTCPPRGRGDDYYVKYTGKSVDPFRFYSRYCTSFAAWRVNQKRNFTNFSFKQHFSNAENWDNAARAAGIKVTHNSPRAGDVAQWNGNVNGASYAGHVGFVRRVYANGDVKIEEYNWSNRLGYGTRRVHKSKISNFIRF
ncbi:MAG: CHAP domain-containing protein [Egibacteraceae bacterium]